MMHGHKALFFVRPLVHREINDPQAAELLRVTQSELTAHLQTQFRQLFTGLQHVITAQDKQQIAFFSAHFARYSLQNVLSVEFIHTGLNRAILLYSSVNKALCAYLRATNIFGQLV